MQNPPEFFTPQEEKAIAEMIETQVDWWQEQKHLREIELDKE